MRDHVKNTIIITSVCLFWLLLSFAAWTSPTKEISESERRLLTDRPKIELESILTGKFMKEFEVYAKDQFPNRFGFRTMKAYTRFYLLFQKDNNDIYIEDGYAAKLEYPLNENSINTANKKLRYLYEKYMKDRETNIFISVIPDKNYYLGANKGYPSMDYDRLFDLIKENNEYAEYIDLTDVLSIEDYYKTDIHWKQENLTKVAQKIGKTLGISDSLTWNFETIETNKPFYGVYLGQSALPLKPDRLLYLTNDTIRNSNVYNVEKDSYTPVYDLDKLEGRDPYDIYLSGATPVLVINNPNANTDRELIVFRDSFGSSLIPLLLEGYSKITLVDIRYIASDLVGDYITFDNQDVLFLYNTLILNSATMLK